MSKHTPGPWLRDGRTVYALQHGGWRKGEELLVNRFFTHIQRVPDCTDEEAEANARLIAAAPELLEALKDLVRRYDPYAMTGPTEGERVLAQAEAAIAKAEGE